MRSQVSRGWTGALGLALALFAACEDETKPTRDTIAVKVSAGKPKPPALPTSIAELRTSIDGRYRLGPDRRFLRAFSDVSAIVARSPAAETTARWVDDHWELSQGEAQLGTLREFPDFTEAYELLRLWAKRELAAKPLAFRDVKVRKGAPAKGGTKSKVRRTTTVAEPILMQATALAELARVEELWAVAPSRASLDVAALSLASLAFEQYDTMNTAERLGARALAVVAINREAGAAATARAEALVAAALGYTRAAGRLASALPEDDSLRAYLTQDDRSLERAARAPTASLGTRYLWARRLVATREYFADDAWTWLGDAEAELPVIATRATADNFVDSVETGLALVAVTLAETGAAAADRTSIAALRQLRSEAHTKRHLGELVGSLRGADPFERFEAHAAKLPSGRLLDRDSQEEYFAAYLTSGLERIGRHHVHTRGDPEAAREFLATLRSSSPRAEAFRQWLTARIDAQTNAQMTPARFEASTRTFPKTSTRSLLTAFHDVAERTDWGDPALAQMVQGISAGLDSRPSDRLALSQFANSVLHDLRLAGRLARAGVGAMHSPGFEVWLAAFDGNWDELRSIARNRAVKGSTRADAIERLLVKKQLPVTDAARELRSTLSDTENDFGLRTSLADTFEGAGQFAEARAVFQEWLERGHDDPGLQRVVATTTIARQYLLEGDLERAWETAAPAVESWQFAAVRTGALIRAAQGNKAEALELAQRLVRRYPGPKADLAVAEVCWRLGLHAKAAEALRANRRGGWEWWEAGEAFAKALASAPDAEALAASKALVDAGIDPMQMTQFGGASGRAGRHRLAFEIFSSLRHPNPLAQVELFTSAYANLKKAEGDAPARAWLEKVVDQSVREPLSMFAFAGGHYELLWSVVPLADRQDSKADFVWLTRATASLHPPPLPPDRQALLKKRFDSPTGSSFSHRLGRYMLGLESERTALGLADSPESTVEVAYFVGRKAETEGRFEDAADWYRAGVQTGLTRKAEYRWAYDELYRWYSRGRNLANLTVEEKAAEGSH